MEQVLFRHIDPYDIKYAIVKNGNGERIIDRIQELEQWAREQWGERTRIISSDRLQSLGHIRR